jgi:hypothetical protein
VLQFARRKPANIVAIDIARTQQENSKYTLIDMPDRCSSVAAQGIVVIHPKTH